MGSTRTAALDPRGDVADLRDRAELNLRDERSVDVAGKVTAHEVVVREP